MTEWLDVVDENDVVMRALPRAEVHAGGWRHRAVHVIVEDDRGRIFLQRRSGRKECAPGLWDSSCAGHVEAGETYSAAVVRELVEELGITCEGLPSPMFTLPASALTGHEFVHVFRIIWTSVIAMDYSEMAAGGWFRREIIARWLAHRPQHFTGTFSLIWNSSSWKL
ncbi:MAG: NUDIX domain-containing protein [Gammaproteobacteria bacterium]|nr:NUDIX domain-containing protein [Gammaproteobacteria bacterium]